MGGKGWAPSVTGRERVQIAMDHGETDRIPRGEIIIEHTTIKEAHKLISNAVFEDKFAFVDRLGLDLYCIHPDSFPTPSRAIPDPEAIHWPDLDAWIHRTDLFIFSVLDGPFGWGMRSLGFKEFIVLPVRSPDAAADFVKKVERLNLEWIRRLADRGIDGVILADDMAYSRGLLVAPETLREFFFPSLQRQVEEAALRGLPAFFHSDGNLLEILPDLVRVGFRGLHCLDPHSGMDVHRLKEQWGEGLCLWGHLVPEDLHHTGNFANLPALAESLKSLGAGGGFILGTTSGLFPGIDVEALERVYASV